MSASTENPLRFAKLTCPRCGYSLAGLPEPRCPECGAIYDPDVMRRRRRQRLIATTAVMLLVIYAPYAWIPFSHDSPGYVRTWLWMWPVLPGLPLSMIYGALAPSIFRMLQGVVMLAITLAFVGGFIALGSRGRWWRLILWALIALALSCVNSWIARNVFLA